MKKNIDCYVVRTDSDSIEIRVKLESMQLILRRLGYDGNDLMVKIVDNDNDKAKEMSKIRDLGIPFSAGYGWSPSTVFDFLREKGLLSGQYREIFWTVDGEYRIETR